ncbi:MAG: hypothetical protein MK160_16730 [Rhodobacteraceae bacterium]|nr:hypothetical protein [Paracoccaceae bacterium]
MVQGLSEFNRRWGAIPKSVRLAVQAEMEKIAAAIVGEMDAVKPLPEIKIGWTWGAPPKGSISVGSFGEGKGLRITIYAVAPDFAARWFEFGTEPRFHKSGKYVGQIAAQPFFYPIWRRWKRRIKARITRAINKALRSA